MQLQGLECYKLQTLTHAEFGILDEGETLTVFGYRLPPTPREATPQEARIAIRNGVPRPDFHYDQQTGSYRPITEFLPIQRMLSIRTHDTLYILTHHGEPILPVCLHEFGTAEEPTVEVMFDAFQFQFDDGKPFTIPS